MFFAFYNRRVSGSVPRVNGVSIGFRRSRSKCNPPETELSMKGIERVLAAAWNQGRNWRWYLDDCGWSIKFFESMATFERIRGARISGTPRLDTDGSTSMSLAPAGNRFNGIFDTTEMSGMLLTDAHDRLNNCVPP